MTPRLASDVLDPRTYGRIGYLLLALPLGIIEFSFLATAICFGVGTAVTLIGIPVLIFTVYAWRWLASVERQLIGTLTGVHIPSPYRAEQPGASWWDKLKARLADPATWKDLVFLLFQLPLGIASFVIATVVLGVAAGLLLAPAYYWAAEIDLGLFHVDTLGEALAVVPVGALVAFIGIPALGALGRLYGQLAAILLGRNTDPELTAEVSDLRDARSRIIAAADAERRRIERDLHDGAQQRLVALALTLRMAEKRADEGDPKAGELVRQAADEAGLALSELRNLARGIHPAILTNRGLTAALDDLAARATVPVDIVTTPSERLPEPVEAAAYFVVSECLANVSKHSGASSAQVSVTVADGRVTVSVSDDGVGGAKVADGTGLQGLTDRVGAVNGTLAVQSPPEEGTRVVASIPIAVPAQVTEPLPAGGPQILSDEAAAERQAGRVRRLRTRLAVLGTLGLVCVVVWALTSGSYFWPIWPLLGLGLVAGLDAWRVLGSPPLSESDVLAGGREPRELRRLRGLRAYAGALAIINLFLIGIWLASKGGYFWPVWPLLGSALAVGLKALRWPSLRDRLLDQAS